MSTSQSTKRTIESLMLEKKLLTEDQLEKAKNIQAQTLERLEDIMIRLGYTSEREVLDLWAEFLGVSVIDLTNIKVDAKILSMIPEYQAKQYKMVPLKKTGNKLTVAMADPFDIMATDMITFLTQCKLEVLIAPKNQIELAVKQLYSWEGFSVSGEESFIGGDSGVDVMRRTSEEGPVVQFLNAIFKQAILKRASDIHIEPREEILLVRFRVDGILHDAMTGPKSLLAPLISRVKILAHQDIAERRLPQDGRLKVRMENREIDFRVSTVPSLLGEKAVLRILQREAAFDLDNLGFIPDDLDRLKSSLDEPYGLILVTGPTGAGKTTTLFGMLKYFNSSEINIFTIENPIEYRIDGITQIQTNEKIGLDFTAGLRAALRQDPDIILVGEVRDLETADIAFRASLTGHKVLSTLHTNNASASINRLINMGVPPYLVTAALRVVIAQKLLHHICPHCKTEYKPSQKTFQRLKIPPSKIAGTKFYKGVGCRECNQTGTYGRLGVYETMVINSALRDVVMESGTEMAVKRIARISGMKTLREIAIQRALEGQTTLEEVLYLTPSDDEQQISVPAGFSNAMGIMPVIQVNAPAQVIDSGTVPQISSQGRTSQEFNPNDPVMKALTGKIEEEYLFFSDEELASNLQLAPFQVKECLRMLNIERDKDGFLRRFGKYPEDFTEDEVFELLNTISDMHGKVPGFIFEEEKSADLFARIMAEQALKSIIGPDNELEVISEMFTEEYCRDHALDQLLEWAHGSLFKIVDSVFPGKFKPWQFGESDQWLKSGDVLHKAAEALDWLMTVKLGCSRGDLPTMLTVQTFKESGLEVLLNLYGGSVFKLVQAVYPDIFKPWQFIDEEALIWFREDRLETAKLATQWLVETRLGIPVSEIPRRISLRDFHQHGLSKLLDLFNQNLHLVVDNAYPGKFKSWEFAEQDDLWKSADALETSREATVWLIKERLQWDVKTAPVQLTRRHFINNGLGLMLGILFNHSPFLALENAYANLKGSEPFQKALIGFSQESREIYAKWLALSEKIAMNHFGKVRFKVTLPNLKVAPIIPETDRIYFNTLSQIEYVPQIVIPKLNAYDDFSDFPNWVPYCDRLLYWVLFDDRASDYNEPSHPKVKLVFVDALLSGLRSKGLLDVVEKINALKAAMDRMLDRKIPSL